MLKMSNISVLNWCFEQRVLHRKCGAPQSWLPWHSSMLLHLRRLIPQSRIPRWKSWKVEPSMNMKIYENLWKSMKIYENLQHANHPQIILSLPYGFRKFAGPPESSPWWGFPAAQRYPPANLRFLACRFRPWSAMIFAIPIWHHMASYGHMAHSREKHVFISQNSSNSDCSDCTIVRLHWILLN